MKKNPAHLNHQLNKGTTVTQHKFELMFFVAVLVIVTALCQQGTADDKWTQWGGNQRDFDVENVQLSDEPQVTEKWRRDLGNGYSAILCEGDRLYTMYRQDDDEHIVCLNRSNGKTIWDIDYPAPLDKEADASFGKGPNSTPMLVGDHLICVGFNSDVHCLSNSDGTIVWKTNLIKDHGGTEVGFGYSASPIHYAGNIILPVGGKGKAVMAFAVADGAVAWSSLDFKNSYGNPLLLTDNGVTHIVYASTDDVIALNPDNGKQEWTKALKNQWNTHAFAPAWDSKNRILFVSSFRQSHGISILDSESKSQDPSQSGYEVVWSDNRSGIGFSNAVSIGKMFIGSTGGTGSPLITAFDVADGKVQWKERGFAKANFLTVGEHLVILDGKGNFAVAKPNAKNLNVVFKQKVLSAEKVWTVPTLVGNTLFMRDQKEIVAMEIK